VLLASSALAVPAAQEAPANGELSLVCLDTAGRAWPSSASSGASAEDLWQGLVEAARPETELTHRWVWARRCPPTAYSIGEEVPASCPADLLYDLTLRFEGEERAANEDPELLGLTAAPVAMWREVPYGLLPKQEAPPGGVSLFRSPVAWRVQACSAARCSSWFDVPADQAQSRLRLLEPRSLLTRVTGDGVPLPGARFALVRRKQGQGALTDVVGFEIADEEGRIELRLPAEEEAPTVISHPERLAVAWARIRDVPAEIELPRGFEISGRVVDSRGNPGKARIEGRSWVGGSPGSIQRHLTSTDADGRFVLAGFPKGNATLRAEGAEGEYTRSLELHDSLRLGEISLARVERAWVRVVDATNRQPVPAARVLAGGSEAVRSDAEGLVEVALPYNRSVQIKAPGYGYAFFDLPGGAGSSLQDAFPIALSPALTVTGRFVSSDGLTPAAGGSWTAWQAPAQLSGELRSNGGFELDLPAGGAWDLELAAGNAGRRRLRVLGFAGERRDLGEVRAPSSVWVFGFVQREDLEPVAGATVSWTPPSELGPLVARAAGRTLSATTDDRGYFELWGLQPGEASLLVSARGLAPLRVSVQMEGLEGADAGVISLSAGRVVEVRSDVGRGAAELLPGEGWPGDRMRVALVDGRAAFEAVPDESFRLAVLGPGGWPLCERFVETETHDLAVRCDRETVGVSGRVTIGGVPGDGMLLWQQASREGELPGGVFQSSVDGLERSELVSQRRRSQEAVLDRNGEYRLDDVMPGAWEVIWAPLSGGFQHPRTVDIPGGADGVLRDFDYAGASIEGVVQDVDGRPVPKAVVETFPSHSSVIADLHGQFQILGLEPGEYQLRATHQHFRSALEDVDLRQVGDRRFVQLRLEDQPAEEHLVVTTRTESGFCFVETDIGSGTPLVQVHGGRAEVEVEPPLGERLRVACKADGVWLLGGWQDLRQALDRGVDFDPSHSSGSIVLRGETQGERVQVTGPGGWDLGRLRRWFGPGDYTVGETVRNLPIGSYVLRRGDGSSQTVRTQPGRPTEVDLGS